MSFISYEISNDKEFQKSLKKAFDAVGDLRIPFRQIAKDFYRSEKAIFKLKSAGQYPDFQGKKIGSLWSDGPSARPNARKRAANMTAYQWAKANGGHSGVNNRGYPLLKKSGRLERSVTSANSPDSILFVEKDFLVIGTSVEYANYHQSDQARKKIPLRKYLFIGPESSYANDDQRGRLDRWTKILTDFVQQKLALELAK